MAALDDRLQTIYSTGHLVYASWGLYVGEEGERI